jgi:hypothetical protein
MDLSMNISREQAIQRYEMIRNEVRTKYPDSWEDVVKLCKLIPDEINEETVWLFGSDKPCWSNITVNIGARLASDIDQSDDFKSAEIIAGNSWNIEMRERGRAWKRNANFLLQGKSVKEFIAHLPSGGLSSYLWRLYAIRNLANGLMNNSVVKQMVNDLSTTGIISSRDLRNWTRKFSEQIGMGWGIVTVYHMLTDLGVTPKPDIHLKHSAIRMGLLAPRIPSNYPEDEFAKVDEHEVVLSVMELSNLITPNACPKNPRAALREVDKVLMEWSRMGLSQPL